MCCLSVTVSLFPGGPEPSRVVFSAGKLADFTGKQGETSTSQATQRTVPRACSAAFSFAREGRSPPGCFCAKLGDLAGNQMELSASQAAQRSLPSAVFQSENRPLIDPD